jgi:hypothetical protein
MALQLVRINTGIVARRCVRLVWKLGEFIIVVQTFGLDERLLVTRSDAFLLVEPIPAIIDT